ncbi:hypothetical protein [Stenomitos frigidus]|uniref:hypothetical protein n=1 Tax=Stenomitos frigidus TaxID=1886765 RepID=UPI00329797D1
MVRQVSVPFSVKQNPVSLPPSVRSQRRTGLKAAAAVVSGALLSASFGLASPGLSQTSFNPGASSPTVTSTSTSSASSVGSIGGMQQQVEQIQGFVGGYLKRFEALKGQIEGVVQDYIGALGDDVSEAIKNALGDLNLPDPNKLLKGILGDKDQEGKPVVQAELNNVSGVMPSILKNNAAAPLLADLWGQANFSTEAQKATKEDLQNIEKQVKASQQVASASEKLTTQSTQASSTSGQAATKAQQQAQQAQKRVSTQDAIKDLNLTAATLSSQLADESKQLASQSSQLASLSQLNATQVALLGDASAKLSQVNLGVAAAVTQLSDMNSQMHGAEQQRIIQENSLVAQTAEASAKAFHLIR